MVRPRLLLVARWTLFGALLLAAAAIREQPGSTIDQAIIWIPTGVAIAGLSLLGLRAWWVVALTTVIQRVMLNYEWGMIVPAAAGSSAEAVLGVLVLRRMGFRASFERLWDVGALLAAAAIAPLGSIFFSWVGRSYMWADPNRPFYSGWDGWWRMNALGVLTVVPIALTWLTIPRGELSSRGFVRVAAALLGIPAILFVAMRIVPPGIPGVMWLNLVLAPIALYAAGRYGVRGATLVCTLSALVVAVASSYGFGPFLELARGQRHVALQLFELTFVAIPPAFGALIAERRAAQDRGVQSDQLRRSIQSALPDITYRLRRDGLCLDVFVPTGMEPPFSPNEVIGRSIFDLLPHGKRAEFLRLVASSFARGDLATIEYEITVGGRVRVREARCVPHGRSEALAVVRDITERKWAEGTMAFEARVLGRVATGRATTDVLAEIVEGIERLAPGGMCSIVVLEGKRMHVAMAPSLPAEYNAAIEGVEIGPTVGSCGAAASLGRTVVVRDIASDPLWAPYRHLALPHGLRACWSVPIRDSDGAVLGTFAAYYREPREPEPRELVLAERAGVLAGIVLERGRRIEALRRSEDLLASINRNVKEGLFRASPELRILYSNLALAQMFGHDSPEDMLGRVLGDSLESECRRAELLRLVHEQGQWLNEEVRLLRVDGTTFWGLLSGTAVRDPDGTITHYDGAVADITARKELEEQFRQSQKMEAVGKLAGGVAHDFNNLLTVIFGYAEAIRAEAGDQQELAAQADQVLDAAKRASRLTRQLLAYSRQQVLSPRVVELTAVVDQMGGMLHRLIGEDIQLVIEHGPGPCWVRVDPGQMEQVLLNLVVNARDAMPDGGTLTIGTALEVIDEAQARAHADLAPGACVVLVVHDTGAGMTQDVQARAFDPFFTTKGPGKGTGLGLSTVYGIVKQSGGAVWLESAPGAGTTVRVGLPWWEAPPEPDALPPLETGGPYEGTVLVVEDEPGVRALVCRTLEREGCTVMAATDGEEALEIALAHAGHIDLVVTDVVMPRLGGRDLATRLIATRPGLRFLFISGYADDVRAPHDFAVPAGAFLAKPFTPEHLVDRVRALLHGGATQA
jgi:PAS domain S-box-containing protein